MSESVSYRWTSGDYSNLITITASAIASVLLVLFKSRCSRISICFGLLSCDRKVIEGEDVEKQKKPLKTQPSSQQPEPEPENLY
jgi:hypothetical protein